MNFVLITPARNEAAYIEKTIQSVLSQTILPARWIIVSDGSTDETDEIVERYAGKAPFITLVKRPPEETRNFASKVHSFNQGLALLNETPYDFIGCLDADVSFGPDYFEYLLGRFAENKELGVGGTHYTEKGFHSFRDSGISPTHVNGQIQVFRRECFADIGGYQPIKGGGIDWVAVTTARMRGWQTYSFGERTFEHHRLMGTAGGNRLSACWRAGKKDYSLGGHPLWQFLRGMFQMTKPPYILGGMLTFLGYGWQWVTGTKRAVSKELMAFHRNEQLARLKRFPWRRFLGLKKADPDPVEIPATPPRRSGSENRNDATTAPAHVQSVEKEKLQ